MNELTLHTQFRKGPLCFEEFIDLVPDGRKADLLDGVMYLASPEYPDANLLLGWLCILVAGFVEKKALGYVSLSGLAYRLDSQNAPEPDIGFVPKELGHTCKRDYIDGPPSLVVEIASPDNVARDYVLKRSIYQKAGVREYWIIDPDERRATFLSLREGRYEEVPPVNHVFSSLARPGFRLDVRWLWEPRPPAYDALEQLLRPS